jgi:hypothetical protein
MKLFENIFVLHEDEGLLDECIPARRHLPLFPRAKHIWDSSPITWCRWGLCYQIISVWFKLIPTNYQSVDVLLIWRTTWLPELVFQYLPYSTEAHLGRKKLFWRFSFLVLVKFLILFLSTIVLSYTHIWYILLWCL